MKPHVYDNGATKMYVYDKYIVAEVGEGIDIYIKEADFLNEIATKHFKDEFGLIDNRINNISINPRVYTHIQKTFTDPKMTIFALVSQSELTRQSFAIEKTFIDNMSIKNQMFSSLEKAQEWMDEILP